MQTDTRANSMNNTTKFINIYYFDWSMSVVGMSWAIYLYFSYDTNTHKRAARAREWSAFCVFLWSFRAAEKYRQVVDLIATHTFTYEMINVFSFLLRNACDAIPNILKLQNPLPPSLGRLRFIFFQFLRINGDCRKVTETILILFDWALQINVWMSSTLPRIRFRARYHFGVYRASN